MNPEVSQAQSMFLRPSAISRPYLEVSTGTEQTEFGYASTLVNAWFVHPQLYPRASGFWEG